MFKIEFQISQNYWTIFRTIPRKSFYIATKVGRYELNAGEMFDFTREKTLTSVQNSLNRLGVDTIDIIQVIFEQIVLRNKVEMIQSFSRFMILSFVTI